MVCHELSLDSRTIIAFNADSSFGKTKYFFPKVNKEDVVVQETKDFLQRIYDGSVGTMMSALVRQNDLSLDDIHELQQILKDAESKAKKSKE